MLIKVKLAISLLTIKKHIFGGHCSVSQRANLYITCSCILKILVAASSDKKSRLGKQFHWQSIRGPFSPATLPLLPPEVHNLGYFYCPHYFQHISLLKISSSPNCFSIKQLFVAVCIGPSVGIKIKFINSD